MVIFTDAKDLSFFYVQSQELQPVGKAGDRDERTAAGKGDDFLIDVEAEVNHTAKDQNQRAPGASVILLSENCVLPIWAAPAPRHRSDRRR